MQKTSEVEPEKFFQKLHYHLNQLRAGDKVGKWSVDYLGNHILHLVFKKDKKIYSIDNKGQVLHLNKDKNSNGHPTEHVLNGEKYIHTGKKIQIKEIYSMNKGKGDDKGKFDKDLVKEALEKVGFIGDVVVEFDSNTFNHVIEKLLIWGEYREKAYKLLIGKKIDNNDNLSNEIITPLSSNKDEIESDFKQTENDNIQPDDSENYYEKIDYDLEPFSAIEGSKVFEEHLKIERNRKIVLKFKKWLQEKNQEIKCEVCNMSFEKVYGKELGAGFIEAHHKKPLAELQGVPTPTNCEDLAAVCSNCHRMLHRGKTLLTVEALRLIVIANKHK